MPGTPGDANNELVCGAGGQGGSGQTLPSGTNGGIEFLNSYFISGLFQTACTSAGKLAISGSGRVGGGGGGGASGGCKQFTSGSGAPGGAGGFNNFFFLIEFRRRYQSWHWCTVVW